MRLLVSAVALALVAIPCWAQADAEEIEHPSVEPIEVSWEVDAKPKKVRQALLAVFEEEGWWPLDPESSRERLVTEFAPFRAERYGVDNVAAPAPNVTDEYMFLQPRKVTQGRVRLDTALEPSGEGTRVRVRSELLVMAFHGLGRGVRAEAQRRSNGSIETYLQRRLGSALGTSGRAGKEE